MELATHHPAEWIETGEHAEPPGTAWVNGTPYRRTTDLGGTRYFRCDAEDLEPQDELHPALVRGRELDPAETAEAFRQQDAIQAPARREAHAAGRTQGREEIRAILRGLIGEPATRLVT